MDKTVTYSKHISHLLSRLLESHSLLTVGLSGSKSSYSSAILLLDFDAEYIVLDELTPVSGHNKVVANTKLHIRGRLDGVEIVFDTIVLEIGGSNGIGFYKASLPEEVLYNQRRDNYRLLVSRAESIPVYLKASRADLCEAELKDISLGGLKAKLKPGTTFAMKPGDVANCTVDLPDTGRIESELQMVHVVSSELHRTVTFGGRFLGLTREHQTAIQRFIAEFEREMIKKRASI